MPRRMAALLRNAGWGLSLLLLASSGAVLPVARPPVRLASSQPRSPADILDSELAPQPSPAAAPTPTPAAEQALSSASEPAPDAAAPAAPDTSFEPPAAAAGAAAEPAAAPLPEPAAEPSLADPSAADAVLSITNDLRARNGLAPVAANGALTAAAAGYAQLMALNDWFSHQGPDGSTMTSRVAGAGYAGWTYLAENLYRGPYGDPPSSVVETWASSPSHREAMLSPEATETGVGCYVRGQWRWCAQLFGAR